MTLYRSAMRMVLFLPLLLGAVSVGVGEEVRRQPDTFVTVNSAPADGGSFEELISRQGTFSNHLCTGAPRDW